MGNLQVKMGSELWDDTLEKVALEVGKGEFARWFEPASLVTDEEDQIVVEVPNAIHEFWIESNYGELLRRCVATAAGRELEVSFQHADEEEKPASTVGDSSTEIENVSLEEGEPSKEEVIESKGSRIEVSSDSFEKLLVASGLNPRYSFDSFVVGDHCEYATATALAAARKPGKVYNPLFIHGGTGLGKTHLMQAIGHEVLRRRPKARVVYVSSEDFCNEFIDGVKDGKLKGFRARYRKADVLLIDDIQFFQSKDSTQDEFFHTFNKLYNANKQIVLTSDLPPAQLSRLEGRLVSRCEWGVTTQLLAPDVETRVAILRSKMDEWEERLDEDVLFYLAERIRTNVRRLEGALLRLGSLAALGRDRLDPASMEDLLRDILEKEASSSITIDRIQRKVAERYDLRVADMMSKRRPANIALPRQIAMFLSRELTRASLKDIGEAFGGRDHGTVIYACKQVSARMTSDENFRHEVGSVRSDLERV